MKEEKRLSGFACKNMGINIRKVFFVVISGVFLFSGGDVNEIDEEVRKELETVSRSIQEEKVSLQEISQEIDALKEQYDALLQDYQEHKKIYENYDRIARLRERDLDIYLYNLDKIDATLQEQDTLINSFQDLFNKLEYIAHSVYLQYYSVDGENFNRFPERRLCAQFYYQRIEEMLETVNPLVERLVKERQDLLKQKNSIKTWKRASSNIRETKEQQKSVTAQKLRSLEELQAEIEERLKENIYHREQLEILITEKTLRQRNLLAQIQAEFEEGIIRKGALPWPTQGDLIESFDYDPDDPMHHQNNPGINIAALQGQKVISVANGVVVYSDWFQGYGNMVIIDHGDSILSLYAHLSEIIVENGKTVKQGAVIGYVGSTASLKGPMLHFAIRVHSEPQDPLDWLLPVR